MLRRLGLAGIFGTLVMFAGLGVITWANWKIGLGVALVLFGLGLTIQSMISRLLAGFGMG